MYIHYVMLNLLKAYLFFLTLNPQRKWSFQRKEVTIRTIMSAILLSAGPISTHYAVRRYGPKYLRTPSIPKEQYVLAATALQEAKLGMLVTIKNATGLSDTFIKTAPSEIEEDLKKNNDLATIEEYTFRFHAPPPACITPAMQASIIQHGLLPPGSFSEKSKRPQSTASHNPSQVHDLRMLQMPPSYVPTINVPSGKLKKEKQLLDSRVVTPIFTSSSQVGLSSSPETLPIMVPFPDPSYKSSEEGLNQDFTTSSQGVGTLSAESLHTMVPDDSYNPNGEDLSQGMNLVPTSPSGQVTASSASEAAPTVVPDELSQDIVPRNQETDISSEPSSVCESGADGDAAASVDSNA